MKTNRLLLSILALLAFLPAIAFAGSNIVRPIEKTFDLNGISKIVVSTQGGFIHVTGEKRSDAHVVIEQVFRNASNSEADDLEAQIESTMEKRGDVLHIEFKIDQSRSLWSLFGSKPSVQFNTTIETAKEIDVELRTSGGPIEVTALDSTVQASTSGGPMKFRDIGGPVKAQTSGGGVRTDFPIAMRGEIKRNQAEGPVNGGGPTFDLKTSGGGINIKYL